MKEFNQYTVQELKDLHEAMAKVIELREEEKKGDTHDDVCAPMNLFIKPAGPLREEEKKEEWIYEVGDWVECVDDGEVFSIHRGHKYRIASFFSGRKIKIDHPTVGEIGPFKISRFKPASPPEPEVIPAEPLREVPEEGNLYYVADLEYKTIEVMEWDGVRFDLSALQAGLAFPDTDEGKAGAEIRAKEGLVNMYRPAKALSRLYHRQDYWLVAEPGLIKLSTNWEPETGQIHCDEGRAFPYTPEGALGAALYQPSNP